MIFQVIKVLRKRNLINQIFRCTHNETSSAGGALYPLENRKLFKVSGQDASLYLQGLITNDMRHLEDHRSMYAMFLNNKGRVLFDTLIHKWEDADSFLIETDKKILGLLIKHLKLYKLKRQVNIEDVSNNFLVWALVTPNAKEVDLEIDPQREINVYKDPRLVDLGFRIVSANSMRGNDVTAAFGKDIHLEDSEEKYNALRYRLGVSEGPDDLPPGSSFPLEANCDYLHGVSFHKGCYIGQELTARVHHTGVIRKRIMPLKFSKVVDDVIEKDSVISASDKPKANLGKFKSVMGAYGLGLMRVKEAMAEKVLTIGKYNLVAIKPSWWPLEAPKEIINSSKSDIGTE